jgi:hypothetical protein
MTDTIETRDRKSRALFSRPDIIDLRDREYEPSLVALKQQFLPLPGSLHIRDQGESPACTGFALASVIDRQSGQKPVSPAMLFAMARLHDDLPDAEHAGSTLRGALKGFFNNGACFEEDKGAAFSDAPGAPPFQLTLDLAERARTISLGAYYRLNHEINDYHTAITDAEAVIVSAKVHRGWADPEQGEIGMSSALAGRHAFAIVGYDTQGFLVQNSWGEGWSSVHGLPGVARWTYEDWFENVEDAWVVRLAISSPRAFNVKYARAFRKAVSDEAASAASPVRPRRQDIYGHYLHVDDGDFVTEGRYAQTDTDIDAAADRIADLAAKGAIRYLLFFAHGALQNQVDVAARAKAWLPVFLRNGIYPVHVMWETGFNNEVIDVIQDLLKKARERAGTEDEHLDERLEALARPLGRKLWRDLKTTARLSLDRSRPGGAALARLMAAAPDLPLHFAAQSAGALLFGAALRLAAGEGRRLDTGLLLAPACSLKFYEEEIRLHFGRTLGRLVQYGLIEKREEEDKLDVYGKSLLYLVSHAVEENCKTPLLGLERDLEGLELPDAHHVFFAGRDRSETDAKSHRGFDSDRPTMNSMLEQITGDRVPRNLKFQTQDLAGYTALRSGR